MLCPDCVCSDFICVSLTARSMCCAVMGQGLYCSKPQRRTKWHVLFNTIMRKKY